MYQPFHFLPAVTEIITHYCIGSLSFLMQIGIFFKKLLEALIMGDVQFLRSTLALAWALRADMHPILFFVPSHWEGGGQSLQTKNRVGNFEKFSKNGQFCFSRETQPCYTTENDIMDSMNSVA